MVAQRRANRTAAFEALPHADIASGLLNAEDERRLARRIAEGDPRAREELIRANIRLVIHIAKSYRGRGLALDDLIAEGTVGLVKAAGKYDGRDGVRFSTYAAHWIRCTLGEATAERGGPIRLPAHIARLLSRWQRAEFQLTERLGRAPSTEEVQLELGLSTSKAEMVLEAARSRWMIADGEGSRDWMLEGVADRSAAPDESLEQAEELETLGERLGRLRRESAEIVRLRYGLGEEGPLTHREIGERAGKSREWSAKIERKALLSLARY